MTNPGNAVGTNAAYGGRTSTNAFNDVLSAYTRGVLNGWQCVPKSGLTVSLGGDGATRDVAVAEDNAGNRTTINNISGAPVDVTIGAAPGADSRIDAIVAYVDNPAQGDDSTADNPDACGLIVVPGTVSSNPVEPSENAIRTAITSDGASGPTAYYVVLATVTIASGTTDITTDNIKAGTGANKGEVFIGLSNSDGSFTLPPGYSTYHIRGHVTYSTNSTAYGISIQLTSNVPTYNYSFWVRRMKYEKDVSPNWMTEEFEYTNTATPGRMFTFGSGSEVNNYTGAIWVDITLERGISTSSIHPYRFVSMGTWHHSGVSSSGITTSEFQINDWNSPATFEFYGGTSRTFANSTIVVTGIKE